MFQGKTISELFIFSREEAKKVTYPIPKSRIEPEIYLHSVNPLFGLHAIEDQSTHFDRFGIDHKKYVENKIILQKSQSQP